MLPPPNDFPLASSRAIYHVPRLPRRLISWGTLEDEGAEISKSAMNRIVTLANGDSEETEGCTSQTRKQKNPTRPPGSGIKGPALKQQKKRIGLTSPKDWSTREKGE